MKEEQNTVKIDKVSMGISVFIALFIVLIFCLISILVVENIDSVAQENKSRFVNLKSNKDFTDFIL